MEKKIPFSSLSLSFINPSPNANANAHANSAAPPPNRNSPPPRHRRCRCHLLLRRRRRCSEHPRAPPVPQAPGGAPPYDSVLLLLRPVEWASGGEAGASVLREDAKEGTTTGVSAKDRAKAVLALAPPSSKPEHFNRPSHIFPLKYREGGGVLKRAGHTEASVDLAMLAGLPLVVVLCEVVDDDDGSMAHFTKTS